MSWIIVGVSVWAQEAQVRDAALKAADWTSYKLMVELTIEDKVAGGGSKSSTTPTEIVYDKEAGLWLKAGSKTETITVGDKIATKAKDGSWTVKAKKQKKDLGQTTPEAKPALPHQAFRNLEKCSDVTAGEEGDLKVYTIALKPEGTMALLGHSLKKSAATAGDELKSTAKLFVGKDGNISKLEITCSVTSKSKSGKESTQIVKSVMTFKDVNATKLEIPDEAKKALAG